MRIVMMGTGTFAEPTFEALLAAKEDVVGLVTQPERDGGNKRGSTRQTGRGMAAIAHAADIPVAQPDSINTPDGLAQLRAFAPDLLVVAAYGQILKPDVIARSGVQWNPSAGQTFEQSAVDFAGRASQSLLSSTSDELHAHERHQLQEPV